MVRAIPAEDIFQYHIALLPGPVDVKIRRALAVDVQKSLKIQLQLVRASISNAQAVGNNALGPAAEPDMKNEHVDAIVENIPGNQEIPAEDQFINNLQ